MRKMKKTVQWYSPELRAEAVRMVMDQGMTQREVAQSRPCSTPAESSAIGLAGATLGDLIRRWG